MGGTVIAAETFVSGQTKDFTPLLSKIKAAGADAIYIEPGYSDAAMIVTQMAQAQGVTEEMKDTNPMQWVGLMNNFRAAAEEQVLAELIYA